MGFLDWLIPHRPPVEPAEAASDVLGAFEGRAVDRMGYLVGTEETGASYRAYKDNQNLFHTVRYDSEDQPLTLVNPERIEAVSVAARAERDPGDPWSAGGALTLSEPEAFWSMHERTREDYMDLLSHVPEINRATEGCSPEETETVLRELGEDSALAGCVRVCYGSNSRVNVWDMGGFYELDGEGRHRVIAARLAMEDARAEAEAQGLPFREEDYYLPVRVLGRMEFDREKAMEADATLEWSGYETPGEAPLPEEWRGYPGAEEAEAPAQSQAQSMENHY